MADPTPIEELLGSYCANLCTEDDAGGHTEECVAARAALAEFDAARRSLQNVRLLVARDRKKMPAETADHLLRFCAEAGVVGSPLRAQPQPGPSIEPATGDTLRTLLRECLGQWQPAALQVRIAEALTTEPPPLPMVLHCPACCAKHVDRPDPDSGWTNPPHRSHLCHACGTIWRPADVPTVGVAAIATRGAADRHLPGVVTPPNICPACIGVGTYHYSGCAKIGRAGDAPVEGRPEDGTAPASNLPQRAPAGATAGTSTANCIIGGCEAAAVRPQRYEDLESGFCASHLADFRRWLASAGTPAQTCVPCRGDGWRSDGNGGRYRCYDCSGFAATSFTVPQVINVRACHNKAHGVMSCSEPAHWDPK